MNSPEFSKMKGFSRSAFTTKIPGYICAYGNNKEDAERALKQYFSDEEYDIVPYEKDKEWYKRLEEQIKSVGFLRESCGFINKEGDM